MNPLDRHSNRKSFSPLGIDGKVDNCSLLLDVKEEHQDQTPVTSLEHQNESPMLIG